MHAWLNEFNTSEEILSLVEKTEREISSDFSDISGEIVIGGNSTPTILKTASAIHRKHPNITFQSYNGDATDVTEQLNLEYFVTTKDLISDEPYNDVVFRPLKLELKIEYNLVWKHKNIFNNAAKVFLEEIKKS